MIAALTIALALGVVAGLRTFTAPAVLLLASHARVAGVIVAVLAVGELIADLLPNTPSRTAPTGLIARLVSGAFVGWFSIAMRGGNTPLRVAGACVGVGGALIGTFGGHALRLKAIARIGAIPAALSEDVVAIAIAILAVA
ncbi:MAG TPA: hypothetical protein VNW46_10785 [Gemmatimonadaceae bacterium]|jgi:uncharacterized membrane protein|nr:hypothetical protein [Gemmatimonadaceae bacterium]